MMTGGAEVFVNTTRSVEGLGATKAAEPDRPGLRLDLRFTAVKPQYLIRPGDMVKTVPTPDTLAEPLAVIKATPLRDIRAEQAARVVRRIVDSESLMRRLDVAAFQSAP